MSASLVAVDLDQCQAEIKEGSFMTLGPRQFIRCTSPTTVIAIEREPGSDGQRGSMGLCDSCALVLRGLRDDIDFQPKGS